MDLSDEIHELEAAGIDLVAILGRDVTLRPEDLAAILRTLPRGCEDYLHSELLHTLTRRRFPEERARQLWRSILRHKERLNRSLGRNVGFRIAALDYLTNREPLLANPRVVGKREFDGIMSFVNVDELTQVYNRRHFDAQLYREVHRARRYGHELSLILIDIDNFKSLNDTHGHPWGDRTLRRFGTLLKDSVRGTDVVCRYGGDEFAILCPGTGKADSVQLAGRLRRAVEGSEIPGDRGGTKVFLRVSMGIATYPGDTEESSELVTLADRALYQGKRTGEGIVSASEVKRGSSGRGPAHPPPGGPGP